MKPVFFVGAADAILWIHLAVIAFNVFGLVMIPLGAWRAWRFVRVFWWRALHVLLLAVVALQAVLGRACFLTTWESDLLTQAGQPASNTPLIETLVRRLIFWHLPLWVFATLYVGICMYTLLLWRLVPPQLPWRSTPLSN